MNPSYENKATRLPLLLHAAGVTLLAVFALAYLLLLHRPLVLRGTTDAERAAQLGTLVRGSPKVLKEHRAANERLERLVATIEQIREHVPENAEEGPFLAAVTEIADQEGLRITDYRRGRALALNGYSRIDLSLKCSGTYDGMCRFVDQLEGLPRVATVTQMTLQASEGAPPYPFEIGIVLYFALAETGDDGSSEASRGAVL